MNRLFTTEKEQMVLQAVEGYQASEDKKLILSGFKIMNNIMRIFFNFEKTIFQVWELVQVI